MDEPAFDRPPMTAPRDGGLPPVHCLLLNYTGWRDTIACLESLLRSDYPALRVVVVDNASPDDSVERILQWARGEEAAAVPEGPLARLVSPPIPKPVAVTLLRAPANLGFAGGNNVGLRYLLDAGATGYAWLLNNDTLVAPDTASRLVERAASLRRCGAVGATLLEYREPATVQEAAGGTVTRWHGMVRRCASGVHRDALPESLPRLDYVSGCSFLTPLEVLGEVGLLDERMFMYAEDIDWSVRMVESGYALGWAREARVWHKGGATAGHGSPVHDYHNVRSSLLFVRKHHPRLVPLALAYVVYRAVLPKVARRQWGRLRAVWRGVRDFFRDRQLVEAAR